MRLYHTGKVVIKEPDIYRGRKNADFGQGFYLSPDLEFTHKWAAEGFYINEYELETDGLNIYNLSRNEEWFNYIFQNRRINDTHVSDVVIGPIANDTLYNTFGLISSGFLSAEESMALLMIGPLYTQVVIKTEKALNQLKWIGAEQASDVEHYRNNLKKEEEQYQEDFAKCMESFS